MILWLSRSSKSFPVSSTHARLLEGDLSSTWQSMPSVPKQSILESPPQYNGREDTSLKQTLSRCDGFFGDMREPLMQAHP
jgi:hypothetical protein